MRSSIVFLGTSLTYFDLWIDVLRDRLQAQTGKFIDVGNLAVNGGNSAVAVSMLPQALAMRPMAAVFETSMNDCNGSLTRAQAIANNTTIVNAFKGIMPANRIFPMTMNPIIMPPAQNVGNRAQLADYYADLRSLSASLGVGLIDNYPAWLTYGVDTTKLPDGVHPIAAAHLAVTVPTMQAALAPLIAA